MSSVPLTKKAINKDTLSKYGFRYIRQTRKPLIYTYEFCLDGVNILIQEGIALDGRVDAFYIQSDWSTENNQAYKEFTNKYSYGALRGVEEIDLLELKEAVVRVITEYKSEEQEEYPLKKGDLQVLADYILQQSKEVKEKYEEVYKQITDLQIRLIKINNEFGDFVCDWGRVSEIQRHSLKKQQAKLDELKKTKTLTEVTAIKRQLNKIQQGIAQD